jgi:hypothetical protein
MILYHFTGPWNRKSILSDGLKPRKYSNDLDDVLHSPFPPCVWLTADPDMPGGHSSYNGLRLTVDIPDKDQQLRGLPTYLREQAKDEFKDKIDAVIASDAPAQLFYCYFGTIPSERLKTDDNESMPAGREGPAQ